MRHFQDFRGFFDAPGNLVLGRFDIFQAEGHVVANRHVRIERIRLKDHRHAALAGRQLVDPLSADPDFAAGDRLQTSDHAQQGRLAAARAAEEDDELAALDRQIDVVQNLHGTEMLGEGFDVDTCHFTPPAEHRIYRTCHSSRPARRLSPNGASALVI